MKRRQIAQPSRGSAWLGVDLAWETHSTGQEKKEGKRPKLQTSPKNKGWDIHWHAAPREHRAERPVGKGGDALSPGSEGGEPLSAASRLAQKHKLLLLKKDSGQRQKAP